MLTQNFFDKLNPKWIIIALMFAVHWYSYGAGLMFTGDSYHYTHASLTFRNEFSLIDNDGNHFLFWPPLFPILLSVFGVEKLLVFINMVISVSIALIAFDLINQVIRNKVFQFLCYTNIVLSVHLLMISTFLWSELIFLLFILIFIHQLIKSSTNKHAMYVAIAFGFLVCLQRFAGLFIVSGVSLWFFLREEQVKQKIKNALLIFATTYSGALCWNLYVWFYQPHPQFDFSVEFFHRGAGNFNSILESVLNAYFPLTILNLPLTVVIACFIIFLMILYRLLRKENDDSIKLLATVSSVYLIFISAVVAINIAGFSIETGEADRFISPIVPLVSILVFKSFEIFYLKQKTQTRKTLVLIVVLCGMIYPLSRIVNNAVLWHKAPRAEQSFHNH